MLAQRQRTNESARRGPPANREIVHGPLGLRTPQGVGRHLELTHAVTADPLVARPHPAGLHGRRSCVSACATISILTSRVAHCMDQTHLLAISPIDGRYASASEPLRALFSEAGLIRERIRVEALWLLELVKAQPQLAGAALSAPVPARAEVLARDPGPESATAVKEIESRINHDVKAIEYYVREELAQAGASPATLELVHFGCTSEDLNNLSYARLLQRARAQLLLPELAQIAG